MIIHLGDHISDAAYLRRQIKQPVLSVPGNCDWSDEPPERLENLCGTSVLFCHGHTLHVKQTLLPLVCRAQEKNVRAALFGHTHTPVIFYEQGVLFLNPGALKDEKCAIMEIMQGDVRAHLYSVDKLC